MTPNDLAHRALSATILVLLSTGVLVAALLASTLFAVAPAHQHGD